MKSIMSSKYRQNLLHLAIIDNRPDEVKRLLKGPSWLSQRNLEGLTPLQIAEFLGRKKCESLLHTIPGREILVQKKGEGKSALISRSDFNELFQLPYLDALRFQDYETLRLVVKNCPYILRIPGIENQQHGQTYAKELDEGFVAPSSIRWIDNHIHYGLFAERDFIKGEWLGEYTGIVREYLRTDPNQNAYCLHYPTRFWSLRYFMVDALLGGNETRFINHSDQPNLIPQCLVKDRLLHTVFFTSRAVKKGEQLTFHYGQDFWRHREKFA